MRTILAARPLARRNLWLAGGWLLVASVVALSLWPRLPAPDVGFDHLDKVGHALAYAALMAWFGFIYQPGSHRWIVALLLLLGISLEGAQHVLGYRVFELADVAANATGVFAGLVFIRTVFFRR